MTIHRRLAKLEGRPSMRDDFKNMSDDQLRELIAGYIKRHITADMKHATAERLPMLEAAYRYFDEPA